MAKLPDSYENDSIRKTQTRVNECLEIARSKVAEGVGIGAILDPNTWNQITRSKIGLNYDDQYQREVEVTRIEGGEEIAETERFDSIDFYRGVVGHLLVFANPALQSKTNFSWLPASKEFSEAIGLEAKLQELAERVSHTYNNTLLAEKLTKSYDKERFTDPREQLASYYARGLRNTAILLAKLAISYEKYGPLGVYQAQEDSVRTDLERRVSNHNLITKFMLEKREFPDDLIGVDADTTDLLLPADALQELLYIMHVQTREMTEGANLERVH
jgi:hypothetical protein